MPTGRCARISGSTDGPIPFDARVMRERVVGVGEQVCALGRYDSEKRAPRSRGRDAQSPVAGYAIAGQAPHPVHGAAAGVIGFMFFAVSHAMLGLRPAT